MLIVGLVLAGIAALLHVYFFVLEAVRFDSPQSRKAFGVRSEDAAAIRPWAFNQGFYNLFLAIGLIVAIVLAAPDGSSRPVGQGIIFTIAAVMVLAGIILVITDRRKFAGALIQAAPPLLAIVALAISL